MAFIVEHDLVGQILVAHNDVNLDMVVVVELDIARGHILYGSYAMNCEMNWKATPSSALDLRLRLVEWNTLERGEFSSPYKMPMRRVVAFSITC